MKRLAPSLSDLLARLTQLEERTNRAEERAAKAEARAAQLENATGNLAAAMVNPKSISRRNLLMKVAGVGAAGVAGSLILNRKDAHAAFTWGGGAANTADLETFVTAASGFTNPAVLSLDGNQAANPNTSIDGLRTYGTAGFSGIAAYGGNKAGTGLYGVGGPPFTATGSTGSGARAYSGVSGAGQYTAQSLQAYQQNQQPGKYTYNVTFGAAGATDHSSISNGLWAWAADHGWGIWGDGGAGNGATPPTGGGNGVYGNSGPGAVGLVGYGDLYSSNTTIGAHGTAGFGNALGVGGWFTGGRAALALGPTGTAGPPATLQHYRGDVVVDANEVIWVCIADGTPGTFQPLQPGGMSNALYTAVSNNQYTLASDGVTWANMDSTNLKLVITPTFNCMAILSAGADLWTFNAGFNQDIGIAISGGAYPTIAGQPEGWKESGGFAGTFSPNAAFVQTIVPLLAGGVYTIQVVWKANKAGASTIAAGAGPIGTPPKFSPTRLTAQLVATKAGGAAMPSGPAAPYQIPASMRPPAQQRPGTIPPPEKR